MQLTCHPQRIQAHKGFRHSGRCAQHRTGRCGRQSVQVNASSLPDQYTGRQFTALATSEQATAFLADVLAGDLRAGDAYCLKGDAGAGKSTWTRAFIQAATGDSNLSVEPPAPGLRANDYRGQGRMTPDEFGDLPILHYDVGGLSRPSDAECEMIAGTFPGAVSIIEWAEELREWGAAPEQRLAIYFRRLPSQPEADVRLLTVVPHTGAWEVRVGLLQANLAIAGPPAGLIMLSDDMAAQLTAGMPECLALAS